MRKSIYISILGGLAAILTLSIQTSAKSSMQLFDLDSEWEKTTETMGIPDAMWNLKSNKEIYVTEMSHDLNSKKGEIKAGKTNEMLAEFTKGRNQALQLVGINDWHITDNKITQENGQISMIIQGGFHDTNSKSVEFKEVHIWQKKKYRSLSVNYPSSSKFGEKSTQVINRFISSVNEGDK